MAESNICDLLSDYKQSKEAQEQAIKERECFRIKDIEYQKLDGLKNIQLEIVTNLIPINSQDSYNALKAVHLIVKDSVGHCIGITFANLKKESKHYYDFSFFTTKLQPGTRFRLLQPLLEMSDTGDLRLRNDNLENVQLEDADFNITILREEGKKLYAQNEYLKALAKFMDALSKVPRIKINGIDLQYKWRELLDGDVIHME